MSAISSGATTFFFDFDIFSMSPITTGSPVVDSRARRVSPSALDLDVVGIEPLAALAAVGLVGDHALGEQARERLAHDQHARRRASARVTKRA